MTVTFSNLSPSTEYRICAYDGQATGGNLVVSTIASNTPATGVPSISGGTAVGDLLTASTSGISDADGLTRVSWMYQWLRDDVNIEGATSQTYTLQAADAGAAIKVRVNFTDDAGNAESLTSGPADGPVAMVTGVSVAENTISSLTVSWTGVTGATGYKVQWKSGSQGYAVGRQATITSGSTTSYIIRDLSCGTQYTARVISVKTGVADGTPSAEATGMAPCPTPSPATNRINLAVYPAGTGAAFRWQSATSTMVTTWEAFLNRGTESDETTKLGSRNYAADAYFVETEDYIVGQTFQIDATPLTVGTQYTLTVKPSAGAMDQDLTSILTFRTRAADLFSLAPPVLEQVRVIDEAGARLLHMQVAPPYGSQYTDIEVQDDASASYLTDTLTSGQFVWLVDIPPVDAAAESYLVRARGANNGGVSGLLAHDDLTDARYYTPPHVRGLSPWGPWQRVFVPGATMPAGPGEGPGPDERWTAALTDIWSGLSGRERSEAPDWTPVSVTVAVIGSLVLGGLAVLVTTKAGAPSLLALAFGFVVGDLFLLGVGVGIMGIHAAIAVVVNVACGVAGASALVFRQ